MWILQILRRKATGCLPFNQRATSNILSLRLLARTVRIGAQEYSNSAWAPSVVCTVLTFLPLSNTISPSSHLVPLSHSIAQGAYSFSAEFQVTALSTCPYSWHRNE